MRVRTAIFGFYLAATTAGLAVLLAFVWIEVRRQSFVAHRNLQRETARMVAGPLVHSWNKQGDLAAAATSTFAHLPADGLALLVTAASGEPVTVGGRPIPPAVQPSEFGIKTYSGWDADSDVLAQSAVQHGWLWVRTPLYGPGGATAWLSVGRPVQELRGPILTSRLRLVAAAGLIAAGLGVAGWILATRLTRSLERLHRHVEEVRAGLRSTLATSRAKEVADLGVAFEAMRTALEDRAYVERFVQSLTHELKSPVTAIASAAELLEEQPPAAERARFLASIRAEARRIGRLAERLLALAAVENRQVLGTDSVTLRVSAVLEEAAARVGVAASQAEIPIALRAGSDLTLAGDRELLVDAVGQLVLNAVEFSPAGGSVELQAERDGDAVLILVHDAGPGVPAFARAHLFERFYSLPRPSSGRKGTGLGLAFVREVALLHGGTIDLTDRPAGGTEARLRLPRVRAQNA